VAGEVRPEQYHAIDLMLGNSLTRQPVDNARAVLVLRSVTGPDRRAVMTLIRRKRRLWLEYLIVTQRRWQRETRNPNKARHHDSIEMRERYVRCTR
jgi:hypothetical protein